MADSRSAPLGTGRPRGVGGLVGGASPALRCRIGRDAAAQATGWLAGLRVGRTGPGELDAARGPEEHVPA